VRSLEHDGLHLPGDQHQGFVAEDDIEFFGPFFVVLLGGRIQHDGAVQRVLQARAFALHAAEVLANQNPSLAVEVETVGQGQQRDLFDVGGGVQSCQVEAEVLADPDELAGVHLVRDPDVDAREFVLVLQLVSADLLLRVVALDLVRVLAAAVLDPEEAVHLAGGFELHERARVRRVGLGVASRETHHR